MTVSNKARIIPDGGYKKFFIHTRLLRQNDIKNLELTTTLQGDSGNLLYRANQYHADIGELKIYKDNNGRAHRCKIIDMYCAKKDTPSIRLCVDILLIDAGIEIYMVWYDNIFDYNQLTSHCINIEPEVKLARLGIKEEPKDENKVNSLFKYLVTKSKRHSIKLKSEDDDGCLRVDVILDDGKSLVDIINDEIDIQNIQFKKLAIQATIGQNITRPTSARYKQEQRRFGTLNNKCKPESKFPRNYLGASSYFNLMVDSTERDRTLQHHVPQSFFKVKVISWYDPENISIIPADDTFIKTKSEHRQLLENTKVIKFADTLRYGEDQPYQIGEIILFKTSLFEKENLGRWLRGIVVSTSVYSGHYLSSTGSKSNSSYASLMKMVEQNIIDLSDIVYMVKSIDYGYQCRSSHYSMRHLRPKDLEAIAFVPPWSLSCSLFGVYPLHSGTTDKSSVDKKKFSSTCIHVMDSWLRERTMDDNRLAFFHIFFRDQIRGYDFFKTPNEKITVSLFHRHEPPYTFYESYKLSQRSTYFHNLNWFLVDTGIASDSANYAGESSQVQLEEYIVNKLVKHGVL